eukprot:1132607-Prymnesium_polylepis.1
MRKSTDPPTHLPTPLVRKNMHPPPPFLRHAKCETADWGGHVVSTPNPECRCLRRAAGQGALDGI